MGGRTASGRSPTTALALLGAAAVLALCGTAVEPYLTAAGDTVVQRELGGDTAADSGLTVEVEGAVTPATVTGVEDELAAELDGDTRATQRSVRGDPVRLVPRDGGEGDQLRVRPVARTGAQQDLELVEGRADGGLLVPEIAAAELGVAPGDTVEVARDDRSLEAEVAGVYRALSPQTAAPELARLAELAEPDVAREQRPLDLVFAAPDAMIDLLDRLGVVAQVRWYRPAPAQLVGRDRARELERELGSVAAAAEDPRTPLGGLLDEAARSGAVAEVDLRRTVNAADRAVAALHGPVRAVATAGQAVAVLMVAGAAGFAAQQRRRELHIAAVRGTHPLVQGAATAVRAAPAIWAGVVLGTVLAVTAVLLSTPAAGVSASALWRTAVVAGGSGLVAMATVAVVTAGASLRLVRIGRRRPAWLHLRWPWELVVLGFAAAGLAQLRLGGGVVIEDGAPSLHPLVLAFPVLLLVGGVGLLLRGGRQVLPRLRAFGTRGGPTGFLVARRLAGARGAALLLTGVTALSLGAVVYSAALSGALEDSVGTKAQVEVGAEAAVTSGSLAPDEVGGAEVHRSHGRLGPDEVTVDLLLVEPSTLRRAVEIDGVDVDGAVGRLDRREVAEQAAPVLLVGADEQQPTVLEAPGVRTPIEVVGRPEAFPGLSATRPLLVAARDDLESVEPRLLEAPGWSRQVWVQGPDAQRRLAGAGVEPDQVQRAAAVAERPRLVAVTWALAALQGFGALTAALALTGVVLFAAVRQHGTQLSYALARRMGLAPAAHRAALVAELVVLLTIALLVGTALGLLASASVVAAVDPVPQLAPPPRLAVPTTALAALGGLVVAAGVAGGLLLHRSAERASIPEVLRDG